MKHARALLAALLVTAAAALQAAPEPKPMMTERGKLLFSDDLRQPLAADWAGKPGKWEIVDGALQGSERAEDHHAAVRRHNLAMRNVVIQYDVRFQGARQSSLSLNDAVGHVARLVLHPNGFTVQRDADKQAGGKPRILETRALTLEPGRWYPVTIEILGEEMLAQVDGRPAFGADPRVAGPKTNLGLTVSGESAQFRNLRVWEAQPNSAWPETRKRLQAERK